MTGCHFDEVEEIEREFQTRTVVKVVLPGSTASVADLKSGSSLCYKTTLKKGQKQI